MIKSAILRVVSLLPTLVGVSVVVFLLVRLAPGSVVNQIIGLEGSGNPEMIARLRAYFGLDQPLLVQYWTWMSSILTGDLGSSWTSGIPVLQLIASRALVTIELAVLALAFALVTGIPLGVVSAVRRNSRVDHTIRVLSLVGLSIPLFFQGVVILLVLSVGLHWIPPTSFVDPWTDLGGNLAVIAIPSAVLGTVVAATIIRFTRASLLEVLGSDYVRTARAKGASPHRVMVGHALRNALVPVVTVAGLQFGYLLGGVVVIEEVFSLPGLGRLVLEAISQRDYPVVQGAILAIALLFMLTNLLVDLLYQYLDPKLRAA